MRIPSFAIRGKITVAITSLLLVMLLMGGMALQKLRVLDATVNDITGNYLLAIGFLADMNDADKSYRLDVLQLVTIVRNDPALTEQVLRMAETHLAQHARAEALYAPTVATPAEASGLGHAITSFVAEVRAA
jgi:hypothetical protein